MTADAPDVENQPADDNNVAPQKASTGLKNLTDWFDHVFVINCAHRPDRLEAVTAELTKDGMADMSKVKIVPAVVGDYTGHPADWRAGRGAWGCLRSHARIAEDLMHMRDERDALSWNSALILEDDVFFVEGAKVMLNQFMEDIPGNWGQLYLGGQNQKPTEKTTSPHVRRCWSVNRTHAYVISHDTIAKFYQHINYMPDYNSGTNRVHIDHQLERAHQRGDWAVYAPTEWICGQAAGSSNISGATNPAMLWK